MTARDALSKEPVIWCFHGNRPHECPHCTPTSKEQLSAGERRFVEARVTKEAGIANRPIVGRPEPFSAGLLLYSYVYEARWAGLRTAEICPRWQDLPDSFRLGWEQLARELATHAPVETSNVQCGERGPFRCSKLAGHSGMHEGGEPFGDSVHCWHARVMPPLEPSPDHSSDRLWEIHKIATQSRVLPEDVDRIAHLSEGFAPIPPCSICKKRHAEPEQDCPQLNGEQPHE